MAEFDHSERIKFIEMADEADRAKLVWMREYMRVGAFSTAYMREANVLMDGLVRAQRQVDNGAPATTILNDMKAVFDKAHAIKMAAVAPEPLPADPRKAFLWMCEMEGRDVTVLATGMFFDRKVQRDYQMFMAGHKVGAFSNPQPAPLPDRKNRLS